MTDEPEVMGRRGSILLIGEELDQRTDEGYAKFTREVAGVLAQRHSVVTHNTDLARGQGGAPRRALSRLLALLGAARTTGREAERPELILYASRSSATVPALLRARLIRLAGHGAKVAMIALQPREAALTSRLPLRWIRPHLLLVGTERERAAARRRGLNAECIWGGVDLVRFRPPATGEKEELRRKWRLPVEDRIMLHIGHLREGRNLSALPPLAAAPGTTMLVVASTHRGPESERIRSELLDHGVRVLEGYLPDVEELYRLADLYVFPPVSTDHAIAMPLSVLEALASDLPVVSMRFGALVDRFQGTDAVRLVETPEELVEQALRPLSGPSHPRRLVEDYSWEAVGRRLDRLLDRMLD
jgi:hypothetical protein